MGQRFYRVVESPRFLERLEVAEPSFVAILLEYVYPILSAEPTGSAGLFPVVYERPFFSIELRSKGGWWGVVIYEVLQDELLVMLHDYLWERLDNPSELRRERSRLRAGDACAAMCERR